MGSRRKLNSHSGSETNPRAIAGVLTASYSAMPTGREPRIARWARLYASAATTLQIAYPAIFGSGGQVQGATVAVMSALTGRPFGPSWRYQSLLGR